MTAATIETGISGDPAAFHALADFLRLSLADRMASLGDETAGQRSTLATAWQGVAGEAFGGRAATMVTASDGVATETATAADHVTGLGQVLQTVQDGMADVRAGALAAGLEVSGAQIVWPSDAPMFMFTQIETTYGYVGRDDHWHQAMEHWVAAEEAADAHRRQWYDALDGTAAFIQDHAADLVDLTAELIVAGAEVSLLTRMSRVMGAEARFLASEVERLRGRATELAKHIEEYGDPTSKRYFAELIDDSIDARYAAESAADAARHPKVPGVVRGGFGVLGAAAAGYGVYADIQDGESTEQAVVSQGTGLVTGVLAAAGTGALVGSVVPVGGTVTGAIVGGGSALIGGVVGAWAGDASVDALYDDGDADSAAEDPGAAILEYAAEVTHRPTNGG